MLLMQFMFLNLNTFNSLGRTVKIYLTKEVVVHVILQNIMQFQSGETRVKHKIALLYCYLKYVTKMRRNGVFINRAYKICSWTIMAKSLSLTQYL